MRSEAMSTQNGPPGTTVCIRRIPALAVVLPCSAQRLFDCPPAPIRNEAYCLERYELASPERDVRRTRGHAKRPSACDGVSSSAPLPSADTRFLRPPYARYAPPQ